MSKLKKRAFVRYSKKGLLVPGSLIITNGSYPNGPSKWFEVPADLCCTPDKCCPTPSNEKDCSTGGYWFDEMTDPVYSYLQSATMDDNCNIYTVSASGSSILYRKFNSSGSLMWEKIDNNGWTEFCRWVGVSEIKVGPDGNIYVVYAYGVKKMDGDGNTIWESYWDNNTCIDLMPPYTLYTSLYGAAFDKLGNMFITGDASSPLVAGTQPMLLMKLNTSTGTVIATKFIKITDTSSSAYISNAPLVDSENNVIMYVAWYGEVLPYGNLWQSTIFKFDNDLNEIWNRKIDENNDAVPGDGDITAFCIDGADNIYCNGYGSHVYKLNKDGGLLWTRAIEPTNYPGNNLYLYNMSVSTEGDVYWIGEDSCGWVDTPPSECAGNRLYIFKFDTNGGYHWATSINNQFNNINAASWNIANEASVYKNRTLLILADTNSTDPRTEYLIKHPLTQVTGVHGDLTFTDVTSYFTPVALSTSTMNTAYTISDATLIPGSVPLAPGPAVISSITNTTL